MIDATATIAMIPITTPNTGEQRPRLVLAQRIKCHPCVFADLHLHDYSLERLLLSSVTLCPLWLKLLT